MSLLFLTHFWPLFTFYSPPLKTPEILGVRREFKMGTIARNVNITFKNKILRQIYSQPAFACSKLTIETLEQGMKYVLS